MYLSAPTTYQTYVCRFLRVIIVSSFRQEAAAQKSVIGIHNDLAGLFKELSQNLTGAPGNTLLAELFQRAAPRKMKTNVWARLRGQQEQLTIQVVAGYRQPGTCICLACRLLPLDHANKV